MNWSPASSAPSIRTRVPSGISYFVVFINLNSDGSPPGLEFFKRLPLRVPAFALHFPSSPGRGFVQSVFRFLQIGPSHLHDFLKTLQVRNLKVGVGRGRGGESFAQTVELTHG